MPKGRRLRAARQSAASGRCSTCGVEARLHWGAGPRPQCHAGIRDARIRNPRTPRSGRPRRAGRRVGAAGRPAARPKAFLVTMLIGSRWRLLPPAPCPCARCYSSSLARDAAGEDPFGDGVVPAALVSRSGAARHAPPRRAVPGRSGEARCVRRVGSSGKPGLSPGGNSHQGETGLAGAAPNRVGDLAAARSPATNFPAAAGTHHRPNRRGARDTTGSRRTRHRGCAAPGGTTPQAPASPGQAPSTTTGTSRQRREHDRARSRGFPRRAAATLRRHPRAPHRTGCKRRSGSIAWSALSRFGMPCRRRAGGSFRERRLRGVARPPRPFRSPTGVRRRG